MKKLIFDQRTTTFLFSLLIATVLWLLIKLSGDFQTESFVKLEFRNLPVNKALINKPDSVLTIKTINNGFDVLKRKLFRNNPSILIDFSKAKHLRSKNSIQKSFIICTSLKQDVGYQFKTAEEVLSIYPDSIIFLFEKLASKRIKVEPQIELSLIPRYKQYQKTIIEPDSIIVYGSAGMLDTITFIKTKKIFFKNVGSTIDTSVSLIVPYKSMTLGTDKIRIRIEIEEFTEAKAKLNIQFHDKSNQRYKIFPSEVLITYQVALKDYSQININDFILDAIPDPDITGKLHLKIISQPKNVIVTHIQPTAAEYIILK